MMISTRYLFVVLFASFVLNQACVTHRKKGETSALGRFYHNTTAKYNGYFNANELMQECFLSMDQSYKDNYNKILPVFTYNATDQSDAQKPKLDKAIEKVSNVVTLHRVSHWSDDCYLLLCRAQYLKKDYETAESSYKFFLEEFDPLKNKFKSKKIKQKTAKAKKEEKEDLKKDRKKTAEKKAKERKKLQKERAKAKKNKGKSKTSTAKAPAVSNPKPAETKPVVVKEEEEKQQSKKITNEGSWLFPHYPVFWEGAIWAGKNLVERGKTYEAEQLYRRVENDPLAPEKLKAELHASYADLYLKTGKHDKAIPYLKSAIELTKSKKLRARYAYILGQLYQQSDRTETSSQYFAQCIKLKPSYDLVFHARMNLLLNDAKAGASTDEIAAAIEGLLKDSKNKDFQGELYYALAIMSLQQNRKPQAIEQFNLSLQSPNVSPAQKGDSYLKLAEIYFDGQDYLKAKQYYDSTLNVLAKNDERRVQISKTVSNLEDIAKHLEIIALQDSLLRIAAMSVKDRRALAIQMKNAKKAKALEAPAQKDLRSRFAEMESVSPDPFDRAAEKKADAKKAASSFFAYDQRATNRGRSEFEQIWGNIVLEDHWRRKNKQSFAVNEIKVEQAEENKDTLESDLAQFLSGVPDTPAEIEEARKKIAESRYQVGILYREKLENYTKSSASLTTLLKDQPNTERRSDALYYLYLNCLDQNDKACANSYMDQILYEFPGSHYAKILSDPEYVKGLLAKRDEVSLAYQKAYEQFESRQYTTAYESLQILKNKIRPPHPLLAKVALLSALCLGNSQGKDVYVNALREVVANFPATPEEVKAKEILRFLKGDQDAFIEVSQVELDKTNYKTEDDKMHFLMVVVFDPPEKAVDKAKISISDYNQNYHKTDNLKMTSLELDVDKNEPLILIRKFDNKKAAMKYYDGIQKKPKEFITGYDNWEVYAITQNNYREVLRIKNLSEYKTFFKKFYLNGN
ncbi:MAG TPA: tetratricopeptide repeat protein [Saprospiraceae bacterium]|nr:tetratricopeptide repeat protein [Saprospiraceae bacterium]